MNARAAALKLSFVVALVCLLGAGRAQAQAPACNVDKDCPGNPDCGGDVCTKSSGGAMCTHAGEVYPSGIADGYCLTDDDCKCKSLGATCLGLFCTFTLPPDGGAAGSTGTGGSTGAGGSTGTGGSGTGSAGTSGGGGGGGGCSVTGGPSLGWAGLALLGAALVRRRSRRRA